MAHYAFINSDNEVTEVIVGKDENDTDGLPDGFTSWEQWYGDFRGMTCKRTSYNNNIRGVYAGVGSIYIPSADIFVEPQPYPSWSLNSDNEWEAPVEKPSDYDTVAYDWSEQAYQDDTSDPKTAGWVVFGS